MSSYLLFFVNIAVKAHVPPTRAQLKIRENGSILREPAGEIEQHTREGRGCNQLRAPMRALRRSVTERPHR